MLRDEPPPMTFSIRNWFADEGGRIAQSLEQALQLPNDVRYFVDSSNEAIAVRLQWHNIAVMFNLYMLNYCFSIFWFFFSLFIYLFFLTHLCCLIRRHNWHTWWKTS